MNLQAPSKRILLVDDHASVRMMLHCYLKAQGYNCVEAENGLMALSLLDDRERVDLVLADNQMPVMSGMSLLAQLSTRFDLRSLPVILYTANPTEELKQQALQAGASAVLLKPFNFNDLLTTVAQAMERPSTSATPLDPPPAKD